MSAGANLVLGEPTIVRRRKVLHLTLKYCKTLEKMSFFYIYIFFLFKIITGLR